MVIVVRALYDYSPTEPSNLSFLSNDLIQVFTQLDSGWWDGQLRDQRGWFPSNYVSSPLVLRSRSEELAWVKKIASDNHPFWLNTLTGDSAWVRPSNILLLPEGWSLQDTDEGVDEQFFYHEESDEMSWSLPQVMWESSYLADAMPLTPSLDDVPFYSPIESKPILSSLVGNNLLANLPPSDELTPVPQDVFPAIVSPILTTNKTNLPHVPISSAPSTAQSIANKSTALSSPWTTGSSYVSPSLSSSSVVNKNINSGASSPTNDKNSSSLSSEHQMQAWSLLTQRIFAAIQMLLKSAKTGQKSAFIINSSQIVEGVRFMLKSSNAVDKDSPAVKNNPSLKQQHRALLTSLSKLVLSAKLASGVWPPPDAVQQMIGDASDLLSAVRRFVEVARTCQISVACDFVDQGISQGSEKELPKNMLNGSPSKDSPPLPRALDSISLDSENIQKLDFLSSRVLGTLKLLYVSTQEQITALTLVTTTRTVVTEIGQFLSLVEKTPLGTSTDSPLTHDFIIHKQALYKNIAALVKAASTTTSTPAPADSMDQVVLAIGEVEKSIQNVLASTQQLLEAKFRKEYRRNSQIDPHSFNSMIPQKPLINTALGINTTKDLPTPLQTGPLSASSLSSSSKKSPSSSVPGSANSNLAPSTYYMNGLKDHTLSPCRQSLGYVPDEIVYTPDHQVKGGTLNALVERLTSHDYINESYLSTFLYTYRTFMMSVDLISMLMQRFSISPPSGSTEAEIEIWIERKMTPIRILVTNVMRMWVDHYCLPYIPDDLKALEQLKQWSRSVMRTSMAAASVQLAKLIEKREQCLTPHIPLSPIPLLNGGDSVSPVSNPPASILPKSLKKSKLTEIDPLEIARQLSLIEYTYFSRLIYTEFLNKAWSSDRGIEEAKARAPNLRRIIDMSNSIAGWVAESILIEEDSKKRCSLLKHFILIAEKCRTMHNYNTLFAISAALNSAPIHRLSRTWEMLSTKTLGYFNHIRQVTNPSKNFIVYRDLIKNVKPPCIPFLGRYLSDLTFIEDGNPDVLSLPDQGGGGGGGHDHQYNEQVVLIHFSKRAKVADIMREIQQFQRVSFNFKPIMDMQDFFVDMIYSERASGELYDISLTREPRETEDQKLVRLLEESGLL